jgi:DNA-binding SARP family transcriptional activator
MGGRIETANGGYRLVAGTEEVDALLFEDLVGAAAGLSGEDRLAAATGALAMWRGTPFDGQAARHPALLAITERLDQGRLQALELRLEACVGLGAHREIIPELRGLVIEFPYHEPFFRLLMISLYRSGRQAEAVALYDQFRNTLVEGLGLEPSRALKDLLRSVLRREIDL